MPSILTYTPPREVTVPLFNGMVSLAVVLLLLSMIIIGGRQARLLSSRRWLMVTVILAVSLLLLLAVNAEIYYSAVLIEYK